jgi:hypothetical protein
MTIKRDRRRFLQTSLVAGTALTVTSANFTQGDSLATPAAGANPQVRPGRVNWHADFQAACAASRSSGKPVLHFHMMGRLDQKFC